MTHLTQKRGNGFTLLELLIALSIFALIALLSYQGLLSMLHSAAQVEQTNQQLMRLQLTFQRLQQDINQLIYRPIRDEYGDRRSAIQGTLQQLELTRIGWRNPLKQPRSQLQRVWYVVEKNVLWRNYWQVLDRTQHSLPQRHALLTGVTAFKLRFLDEQLAWHEEWQQELVPRGNEKSLSLKAIEMTLVMEGWGELIWLFATTTASSSKLVKPPG